MNLKVMAKPRREHQHFTSFRRAGIDFPVFQPGLPNGGPLEVTVVDPPAFADSFEIDNDGLTAILTDPMLIVEDSEGVRAARKPLVDAAVAKREPFVGAHVVKAGGFEAFEPDSQERPVDGDGLDKLGKPELMDMAENLGIADARKLNKGPLIDAIRSAQAEVPE